MKSDRPIQDFTLPNVAVLNLNKLDEIKQKNNDSMARINLSLPHT